MSATLERLGASAGQATRFVKLLGTNVPPYVPLYGCLTAKR